MLVLIPPPVDPGDAPINIRKIRRKTVGAAKVVISWVLKPAVRAVTTWNRAVRALGPGLSPWRE